MSDAIFQATMTGLQVQHIATWDDELPTCDLGDGDAATLFTNPQFADFDQIPVRKNGSIIGVITRECEGSIKQCLQPLTETMLIAAQEPLTQFISQGKSSILPSCHTKRSHLWNCNQKRSPEASCAPFCIYSCHTFRVVNSDGQRAAFCTNLRRETGCRFSTQ
jgi:hypothetical protein